MNAENRIFASVQMAFVLFVVLAVALHFVFFTVWHFATLELIYFFVVATLSAAAIVWTQFSSRREKIDKVQLQKLIVSSLMIFIGSLIFKAYINSWIPIWADEISQHAQKLQSGPFFWAAHQQQPPLGYFLSFWTAKIFGITNLGIRGLNFFIGSLMLTSFFIFLKKRISSNYRCMLYTSLFFLSPLILQYNIEARTISLGLILALFLFDSCLDHRNEIEVRLKTIILISTSSFLLLSSLGFQSFIFLAVLGFLQIAVWLRHKKGLSIVLGILIAIILFSPIELIILKSSTQYIKSSFDLPAAIENLKIFIDSVEINKLFKLKGFAAFAILIAIVSMFRRFEHYRLSLYGLIFTITFVVIGSLVYFSFVNYQLEPRYLILTLIPFYFSLSMILESIYSELSDRFSVLRSKYLAFTVPLIFVVLSFNIIIGHLLSAENFSWRIPSREATRYIIKNMTSRDILIPICSFNPVGCWDYHYLLAYLGGKEKSELIDQVNYPVKSSLTSILKNEQIQNVYLYISSPISKSLQLEFTESVMMGDFPAVILRFDANSEWVKLEKVADRLEDNYNLYPNNQNNLGVLIFRSLLEIKRGVKKVLVDNKLSTSFMWEANEFRQALQQNQRVQFK